MDGSSQDPNAKADGECPCGAGGVHGWIREGKTALSWTRLSCHASRDNAVRLQLFALAYNRANFLRSLVLPEEAAQWSLRTLRE